MANSILLDTDVWYGEVEEVETWIRNKDFSTSTDVTTEDVESKLRKVSEKIDRLTGRAWRERRMSATRRPSVSAQQRRWYERGRRGRSSGLGGRSAVRGAVDPWSMANLPTKWVREIDAAEDDEVVVLLPRSENDITEEEGRSEGSYHLDLDPGRLYVHVGEFRAGPIRGGGLVPNPKVRVSYRYGREEIPEDIHEAAEKWVAADLINTDSYGAVLGAGPDNVPDMTTGASELFADARDIINRAAGKPIL